MKLPPKLTLIGILLLGAFFRFFNLNWDQNQHLHPDERFLTMVGVAMKIPASLIDYFNQHVSTLNPANIGYEFFVYGTLPIVINKLLAIFFAYDDYFSFTLYGRFLSGVMDLLVVLLVYKTLLLFEKKHHFAPQIKYWGAFFYAIAVLPIQLSHFFTVDTFLNFFTFASFYTVLKFSFEGKIRYLIASAILLGFGFATKATAVFIVPLILFFLTYFLWNKENHTFDFYKKRALQILIYGLVVYASIRIGDPYLFESSSAFDPHISKLFLTNLDQLNSWGNPQAWFPPGVQWLHKPPIAFALKNIIFFGVGIPYFVFLISGMGFLLTHIKHRRRGDLLFILLWVILFFVYQSTRSAKTMRYFILIYPFFALFAAFGFYHLTQRLKTIYKVLLVLLIMLWPLMFFSIYTKVHSRTSASYWIYNNIPAGNVILGELWDDGLPIGGSVREKQYNVELLPVFDEDTAEKWQKMNEMLKKGDYYILSSNRGWGSIPTAPERYPHMTKFYQDLLAGKLQYKKVAEITSYPSLRYLGIPLDFPDDFAEEAFTVYDHPKVMIFKKE